MYHHKYFLQRICMPICSAIMDWVVKKHAVVVSLIILIYFAMYKYEIYYIVYKTDAISSINKIRKFKH